MTRRSGQVRDTRALEFLAEGLARGQRVCCLNSGEVDELVRDLRGVGAVIDLLDVRIEPPI